MRDKWLRKRLEDAGHIMETEERTPWITEASILSRYDKTQEIVSLLLEHLGLRYSNRGRLEKVRKK